MRSNRILERFFGALFFNQSALKDRPLIKACVIRPPQTPAVFMLFLNWNVNQSMHWAFFVESSKWRELSRADVRNASVHSLSSYMSNQPARKPHNPRSSTGKTVLEGRHSDCFRSRRWRVDLQSHDGADPAAAIGQGSEQALSRRSMTFQVSI